MLSEQEKCQLLLEDFAKRTYQIAENARKQGSFLTDLANKIQDQRIARYWSREYDKRWK